MNKMIRAVLVLALFALNSALFAASYNLGYLDGHSITFTRPEAYYDGFWDLYVYGTSNRVAEGYFYNNWDPASICALAVWYDETQSNWTYQNEVTIYNVPAGYYTLTLTGEQCGYSVNPPN